MKCEILCIIFLPFCYRSDRKVNVCSRCLMDFPNDRKLRNHVDICPNKVDPTNPIDELQITGGFSKEKRMRHERSRIKHAVNLLTKRQATSLSDRNLIFEESNSRQPQKEGAGQNVQAIHREETIPIELERWYGDFPVTHDKTVKDLADWDCMGEINEWFNLRPNDRHNSDTLQKWFHCLPLGRGRRVLDVETWENMDEERRKWFDMRPSVAKTISIRFGMSLNKYSILTN